MSRYKLWLILLAGALIRIYGMMYLSLGEWDERYHALVSKNLVSSPLEPVLIDDGLIKLDPKEWALCHVWLAKPPLALWVMASGLKIFGYNELGLRFFSLLISVLSIYLTYLIGKKLFNEKIGLLAAFFYSINGLLYVINIGQLSGDHVDTLFHFLFQLAVYFLLIKSDQSDIKPGVIVGFIAGLAFLTKWIMAFFILMVCITYFGFEKRNLKSWLYFSSSALTLFFLTISPWLFWIYAKFPMETSLLYEGIIKPISGVVQNHEGSWYYYVNAMRIYINELIYLPCIFLLLKCYTRLTKERFLLLLWIGIPLVLLSVSATKREVYLFVSATPFFILIALFLHYLDHFRHKFISINTFVQSLFYIAAIRYSVERIKPMKPRLDKPEYRNKIEALVSQSSCPPDSIVLNNEPHHIEARFYYGVVAYPYLNDSTVHYIKSRGYTVFENQNGTYVHK